MSGTDAEDLPDDTKQAIAALRRLVGKHQALTRQEALEAIEALVADIEVEVSPEELLEPSREEPETAGEKESPTA